MKTPVVRHREETPAIECPFGHVQRIVTGGEGGIANVHVVIYPASPTASGDCSRQGVVLRFFHLDNRRSHLIG